MSQRIVVVNGELVIGLRRFPLESSDVDAHNFSYTGLACLQGNKMRVITGRSTIYDFDIGEATQESIDYEAGYERGMAQKRRREPRNQSTDFFYGWLLAWKERGR